MNRALVVLLLGLLAAPALAADSVADPGALRVAGADTVRSNLWLTQALLADVVREAAAVLPAGSGVILRSAGVHEADPLMAAAAYEVLTEAGHDVFVATEEVVDEGLEPEAQPVGGHELVWDLERVDLAYPRVGRFLGLWSRWVDRDLEAQALVSLRDRTSGRMLLDRRIVKTYTDRIDSDRVELVNSDIYPFTAAEPAESGLRGILEEVVVIGALTSMVAIYFANSGS